MKAMNVEFENKGSEWKQARSVMAQSFYKEMKSQGYSVNQIIEVSSELLGLVTGDIKASSSAKH